MFTQFTLKTPLVSSSPSSLLTMSLHKVHHPVLLYFTTSPCSTYQLRSLWIWQAGMTHKDHDANSDLSNILPACYSDLWPLLPVCCLCPGQWAALNMAGQHDHNDHDAYFDLCPLSPVCYSDLCPLLPVCYSDVPTLTCVLFWSVPPLTCVLFCSVPPLSCV